MEQRIRFANYLEAIAISHILFPLGIFVLAVIGFSLGLSLSAWYLLASAVLSIFALFGVAGSWRIAIVSAVLTIFTHAAAYNFAKSTFDMSWDGLAYHQEAVIRLAESWNPMHELTSTTRHAQLIDYFPKASWISGAAIFIWADQIETGKLFQLTLIVAAWCAVAGSLLRLTSMGPVWIVLLATAAAGNPVSICQSTTFLVDGLIASALTIGIAALSVYVIQLRWQAFLLALAVFAFAINLKFPALVYSVIFLGFATLAIWLHHGRRIAYDTSKKAAVAVFLATFLLGYAPYTINLIVTGELFYPIRGRLHPIFEQNLKWNTPANLIHKDRFSRFAIANLSKTESIYFTKSSRLKRPLSVSRSEMKALGHSALQAGGFGPLFGGLLLMAILSAVPFAVSRSFQNRFDLIWVWCLALVISIFVHDVGWWARFVPHAWLIPLLIATAGLLSKSRPLRLIAAGVMAVALFNVAIVTGGFAYKQRQSIQAIKHSLKDMRVAHQPVAIYFKVYPALRQRFREAGISFVPINKLTPRTTSIPHKIPAAGYVYWEELK